MPEMNYRRKLPRLTLLDAADAGRLLQSKAAQAVARLLGKGLLNGNLSFRALIGKRVLVEDFELPRFSRFRQRVNGGGFRDQARLGER
ncbi:hypothetical protein [Rhizobium sullae]|uniref:hypothetical protein n=1 Tax=Rhizobium sullae TaxID=50338 RepID=UPI0012FD2358|nr:hypothetical protein [Rhizobium sullae]